MHISVSNNFFVEVSSAVSKVQFAKEESVKTNAEKIRVWADWKEATKWLNKRSKITATLDKDPEGNGKNLSRLCITVERKRDIRQQCELFDYYPIALMC